MLKVLRALLVIVVVITAGLFAGPVSTGAVFFLLPTWVEKQSHDLREGYEPLHDGDVDLGTGLYIREDEDLVVRGTPPLILRRTYLSGDRVQRPFGIGTTHPGEIYLHGDGQRFQWASLILATGSAIRFERITSGETFVTALYEHRASSTQFYGARLGWTGLNWALRQADGGLDTFQPCGRRAARICSITSSRDADGHTIHYRRDAVGRLLRMDDGGARWIGFEYDAANRIARAHDSTGRRVRYEYDARGRLTSAAGSDGAVRRYGYTDLDELATISEPGWTIENTYERKRVVRQTTTYPEDEHDPYVFEFDYELSGNRIVRTTAKESDGAWQSYTWDANRSVVSEARGGNGTQPAIFTYERDPETEAVTALTLTCPDRTGRPLRHSSIVKPGRLDWIKWDLLNTHCYWRTRRSDR